VQALRPDADAGLAVAPRMCARMIRDNIGYLIGQSPYGTGIGDTDRAAYQDWRA
jgi:hypothetical protein